MKLRFFITILVVVSATVIAVSFVYSNFSTNERQRLLDQQIESHASLLLSSGLSNAQLEDFEEADTIVTDLLGGTRINQVIVIYNRRGEPIYQNKNASLIQLSLPDQEEGWSTLKVSGQLIRLLTVLFPAKKRKLQIGLVLNETQDRWEIIRHRVGAYVFLIMTMAIVISFILTSLLVRPVIHLATFLRHVTDRFDSGLSSSASEPLKLFSNPKGKIDRRDEFVQLTLAIQGLLDKTRNALVLNNTRSAQLAHELKTPLTVIRNHLEKIRGEVKETGPLTRVHDCLVETDRLGRTITDFLEWSVTENSPGIPQDIHALDLAVFAQDVLKSLDQLYPGRLRIDVVNSQTVFSRPAHLEQVISNLTLNALKYSPGGSHVQVKIQGDEFVILNEGQGISQKVLDRLGSPFNLAPKQSGSPERGSGLGLAWVHTICSKYQWPFKIENTGQGTRASVVIRTGEQLTSATR